MGHMRMSEHSAGFQFRTARLSQALEPGVLTLLAIMLGVILWGLNKGFDFYDEGYYVARNLNPELYFFGVNHFDRLIHSLFGWMTPNILTFRWISLGFNVAGGVCLTLAAVTWFSWATQGALPPATRRVMLWFGLMGALLFYYFYPRSVGYDVLNGFFMAVYAGGLLISQVAWAKRKFYMAAAALLCAGFAVGIDFFIKWPTAMDALLVGSVWILSVHRKTGALARLALMGVLILGAAAGLLVFFQFMLPWERWLEMKPLIPRGESPFLIYLRQYFSDFRNESRIWVYAIPWIFMVVKKARQEQPEWLRSWVFWFFFLAWGIYAQMKFLGPSKNHVPYFILLSLAVTGLLLWFRAEPAEKIRLRALIPGAVLLLILPGIGSFGTANSLMLGAVPFIAGWVLLLVFAVALFSPGYRFGARGSAFLLVVAFQTVLMLVVHHNFRSKDIGSLSAQNTPIYAPAVFKGLWMAEKQVQELNALKKAMVEQGGFQTGDPVLSLFGLSGYALYFEGISPGAPWFFYHSTVQSQNCWQLKKGLERADPAKVVVLTNQFFKAEHWNTFVPCMNAYGIRFPAGYQEVTVPEAPEIRLYVPQK